MEGNKCQKRKGGERSGRGGERGKSSTECDANYFLVRDDSFELTISGDGSHDSF